MVGMTRASRLDAHILRLCSFAVETAFLAHVFVACSCSPNIRAEDDPPGEGAFPGTFNGRPITFNGVPSEIGDAELKRLFVGPVWDKFLLDHKNEISPRDEEIEAFIAYEKTQVDRERESLEKKLTKIDEQITSFQQRGLSQEKLRTERSWIVHRLQPVSKHTAAFQIEHWKASRLLYDTHGKGDVIFQQRGVEAIDALQKLISRAIYEERLVIHDKVLRERVLQYYPGVKKTSLVIERDEIEPLFLAPGWTKGIRAKSPAGTRPK